MFLVKLTAYPQFNLLSY